MLFRSQAIHKWGHRESPGADEFDAKSITFPKKCHAPPPTFICARLILIVLVGAIVAAISIVGKVLEWSVTPDLSNLKNIVLQEMQVTQWFKEMTAHPEAQKGFQQGYDMMWQFMGPMFAVDVLGAVLNTFYVKYYALTV